MVQVKHTLQHSNKKGAALSSVASTDNIYGHGGGQEKKFVWGVVLLGARYYIEATTDKG